jgi:hypothetical protein
LNLTFILQFNLYSRNFVDVHICRNKHPVGRYIYLICENPVNRDMGKARLTPKMLEPKRRSVCTFVPVGRRGIGRQLQLPVGLFDGTEYVSDAERCRMVQLLQMAQDLGSSLMMMLGAQAHSQLDPIELGQQPVEVAPVRHHGPFPVAATCRHGLQDHGAALTPEPHSRPSSVALDYAPEEVQEADAFLTSGRSDIRIQ